MKKNIASKDVPDVNQNMRYGNSASRNQKCRCPNISIEDHFDFDDIFLADDTSKRCLGSILLPPLVPYQCAISTLKNKFPIPGGLVTTFFQFLYFLHLTVILPKFKISKTSFSASNTGKQHTLFFDDFSSISYIELGWSLDIT